MPLPELLALLHADTLRTAAPLENPRPPYRDRDGNNIISRDEWYNAKRTGRVCERVGVALIIAANKLDPSKTGVESGLGSVYLLPSYAATAEALRAENEQLKAALERAYTALVKTGRHAA